MTWAIRPFSIRITRVTSHGVTIRNLTSKRNFDTTIVTNRTSIRLFVRAGTRLRVRLVQPFNRPTFKTKRSRLSIRTLTLNFSTTRLPIRHPSRAINVHHVVTSTRHLRTLQVTHRSAGPQPTRQRPNTSTFTNLRRNLIIRPSRQQLTNRLVARSIHTLLNRRRFNLAITSTPTIRFVRFRNFGIKHTRKTALGRSR